MDFFRGVLGVLCVFFAYMAGRSAVLVRQGGQRKPRLYGWAIRTVLCGVAVILRQGLDAITILVWALAAVAFAGAMWLASHQKSPEDLTDQIFPE